MAKSGENNFQISFLKKHFWVNRHTSTVLISWEISIGICELYESRGEEVGRNRDPGSIGDPEHAVLQGVCCGARN